MVRQRSVFDIVGPVMIGPSSSHTAGACRLGALALAVFGSAPKRAHILLHGSFASTGAGHGTDLALVAGLLGMHPDDPRIPRAFEVADDAGLSVSFAHADLGDVHPNTAVFELEDVEGNLIGIRGSSLGGGDVVITQIDAFEVEVTGDLPVLVVGHVDRPGVIAGVTGLLADSGANVASMQVSRAQRGASALMLIVTDAEVDPVHAEMISRQSGVTSVRRVPAV
jgi:L-serine dehydratase